MERERGGGEEGGQSQSALPGRRGEMSAVWPWLRQCWSCAGVGGFRLCFSLVVEVVVAVVVVVAVASFVVFVPMWELCDGLSSLSLSLFLSWVLCRGGCLWGARQRVRCVVLWRWSRT